jgi:uncharacterized protein involved in outer membrane biogenesis
MKRTINLLLLLFIGLLAFIVIGAVSLLYVDWNNARPWLNDHISKTMDRPFAINGDFSINWLTEATETEWRRWIPWPHIVVHDVSIGNPKASKQIFQEGNFAIAKEIKFAVDPLALLQKKVIIPGLELTSPHLSLQREADGKDNWTFQHQPSSWNLELGSLAVTNGVVEVHDAIRNLQLSGNVDTVGTDGSSNHGLKWNIDGTLNGATVAGHGTGAALLSLQNESVPYPLSADLKVGKTQIHIKGEVTKPNKLAALNLYLDLSGDSLADLYPLSGLVLPKTPPYKTRGRLIGRIEAGTSIWNYENFKGKIGDSDFSGHVEYTSAHPPSRPRPVLTGKLLSNQLVFKDLAPIIGAGENAKNFTAEPSVEKTATKILPTQQFQPDHWRNIDVDIQYTGNEIIRAHNLPIDNLDTHISLRDGILSLLPLEFGIAGGKYISNIRLDGRSSVIKVDLNSSLRHVILKKLAPKFEPMQSSIGEINGDIKLSGTGNSVAEMLGTANGNATLLVNNGTISKLLLDEVGLNVINIVFNKIFGDKQITLNCIIGDATFGSGIMQLNDLLIDTNDANITVDGQIDFRAEKLAMTVRPENRKFRLISLRTPIYIDGTLAAPTVDINKTNVAMRAGGAIALSVLNPFASLLPLIDLGPGKDSDCARYIKSEKQGKLVSKH